MRQLQSDMLNLNRLAPLWTTTNCCQWRNCWKDNTLLKNDQWLSVDLTAESVGISNGSAHLSLREFVDEKVFAQWSGRCNIHHSSQSV